MRPMAWVLWIKLCAGSRAIRELIEMLGPVRGQTGRAPNPGNCLDAQSLSRRAQSRVQLLLGSPPRRSCGADPLPPNAANRPA